MAELKKGGYDAVLIDIRMPALDGPTLVQMIRRTTAIREIRIILCSGLEKDNLAALSARLQADGFIPKSSEIGEVAAAVDAVLAPGRPAPA
jgi:DNA-binding NarL/FixJ family response regulator